MSSSLGRPVLETMSSIAPANFSVLNHWSGTASG